MLNKHPWPTPKNEDLHKLLQQAELLAGRKVLVIGDSGLDEYIMGGVRRISPEAPVPVLEVEKEDARLGMSANVAQNISSLGSEPILISVVGKDLGADRFREVLGKEGVDAKYLIEDSNRPTTRKARVMTGHNHIVRVDYEHRHNIDQKVQERVLAMVESHISECDTIILQDYAKGMLNESVIQQVFGMAEAEGKNVLVDPHRTTSLKSYKGSYLFKPNFDESLALLGESFEHYRQEDQEAVLKLGQRVKHAVGASELVLTRGSEGMVVYSDEQVNWVPTYARQVFDVTGAGDTVVATLALAKAAGLSLLEACVLANFAAGFVVGKVGCVPCSVDDLKGYIESRL